MKKNIHKLALYTNAAPCLGAALSLLISWILSLFFMDNSLYYCFSIVISEVIVVLLPIFLLCKIYNKREHYSDPYSYFSKLSFSELIPWLFFGIIADLLFNFLNGIMLDVFHTHSQTTLPKISNFNDALALFLVIAIISPIIEELAFRKILFGTLRKEGNAFGIIFSGILFGIWHGDFSQMFFATGLGIILGYIVAKTGNICITIMIHTVNNSIAFFSLLYQNQIIDLQVMMYISMLIFVISIIGFVCFAVLIHRRAVSSIAICNTLKKQNWKKYKYYFPFCVLPIVVFLVITLLK